MEKTISFAIQELKEKIAKGIEESNLDASIIELILQDYLNQIHIIMMQQHESIQIIKEEPSDGEHINPDSGD